MKNWTTPSFEDIRMSAEIGSYQEDYGNEDGPRFIAPEAGAPKLVDAAPRAREE